MYANTLAVCYPNHPVTERLLAHCTHGFDSITLVAHDERSLRAARKLRKTFAHRPELDVLNFANERTPDAPALHLLAQLLPAGKLTLLMLTTEDAWLGAAADDELFQQYLECLAARADSRGVALSTLAVAGDWSGLYTEWDGDAGQSHATQKGRRAMAREARLKAACPADRLVIARVGELLAQRSAPAVSDFDQLLRRLCGPTVRWLTADAATRVPVTHLSELALLLGQLMRDATLRGTFHATATRSLTLAQWLQDFYPRAWQPTLRFLPPALRWAARLIAWLSWGRIRPEILAVELAETLRGRADVDAYRNARVLALARAANDPAALSPADRLHLCA